MTPQERQEFERLKTQVAELAAWKEARTRQQIAHPLDVNSIRILNENFMRIKGAVETSGGAAGNTFIDYIGTQGNIGFIVGKNNYIPYTVNVTTDFINTSSAYFPDDTFIYFATSDTVPSPLSEGVQYFVVNATADQKSFQVSATQGGAPIDITDSGVGNQYIYYF